MGKDVASQSDPTEGLGQSPSGLKEEVTGQEGATVKHEVRPFSVMLLKVVEYLCFLKSLLENDICSMTIFLG